MLQARDRSQAALEKLFGQYREPLLVWLRAQGYAQADAEDLLHGFLQGLLRKEAFRGVASEKGSASNAPSGIEFVMPLWPTAMACFPTET